MNTSSTPLMSLAAIGLDIEATVLDARTARVIEIAALRVDSLEIDILHEVGIPYCPGGVMAKYPACRRSIENWKSEVSSWIEKAELADALSSDIFFDGVPVYGEVTLASGLMDFAFARAINAPLFLSVLGALARDWYPPITFFGRLHTEKDRRLDLKRNGLLPVFTLARMLAPKHGIRVRSTVGRLSERKARLLADADLSTARWPGTAS